MSLLLKALEKSEENQETTETAAGQQADGASSSLGGMKLSGGGQSKLGSALAGVKKEKSAKKVVAAYQEDEAGLGAGEVDAAQEALVRASRAAFIRNLVVLVVVAVVGYGGWQAYQGFFPSTEQQTSEERQSVVAVQQEEVTIDDTVFLPLAEPIYDIQENILTASVAPDTSSNQQRDVVRDVQSYVERILEEQLRKSEEAARVSADGEVAQDLTTSESEQLSELLSEEVNWEEIEPVGSSADMLAKLEALSQVQQRENAKQFIRKSGGSLSSANVSASDDGEKAVQVEKPKAVAQITKKANGLGKIMDKALAQYRSGDLSGSEISFRTILASEPRNSSALVGLAKVHHARGNNRLAVATLLKAAEYSPNNPVIISELISVQSSAGSPTLTESRVLDLLGRTNDKAIQSKLLFILGNIHAERQNWIMAKSMYYEAHQINQKNPDFAYNLAVVYDYLGDKERAVAMYSTALNAALEMPSTFNHQAAKERIDSLSN